MKGKNKKRHFDQDELIEYFYNESPISAQIEEHLAICQVCKGEFFNLKQDMDSFSTHFTHKFWDKQRSGIMARVDRITGSTGGAAWAKWLQPAFAMILIVFIFAGIYFSLFPQKPVYTEKDYRDEMILERVAELLEQPLATSLDFIDFQEEYEGIVGFEELTIFDYWPELET